MSLKFYKDVNMKTLLEKNHVKDERSFGPDPLLYKKKGLASNLPRDILEYRNKMRDDGYMKYAIDKIAVELMHFLVK